MRVLPQIESVHPEGSYFSLSPTCFYILVFSIFTACVFVTNGWQAGEPSLTTLTLTGFAGNAKHSFSLLKSDLVLHQKSLDFFLFCSSILWPEIVSQGKTVYSLSDCCLRRLLSIADTLTSIHTSFVNSNQKRFIYSQGKWNHKFFFKWYFPKHG